MRSIHVGRILLLLIALFGCQKGDIKNTAPEPPPAAVPVTAQLVLPEGSALSGTALTVTNGRFEVPVVDNSFSIDSTSASNTFSFVTDSENRPYLIKFYDNTVDDKNIGIQSTAIALVMSSPLSAGLTPEGRKSLIQFVTKTDEFAKLEEEIKNNLVQGRAITDSSNTNLRNALLLTFERMSAGGAVGDTTAPLLVERNAKTVTIKNNGAANTYVAGVYKGGDRVNDFIVIRGTERYAQSVGQAVSGLYAPFTSAAQKDFVLGDNGNYQVRVRSGSLSAGDNSDENLLAAKINIIDEAWSIAERFMPMDDACVADIKSRMVADYVLDVPQLSGSMSEVANAVHGIAAKMIGDNISLAADCFADRDIFGRYSETVKLFTSYLAAVSQSATGAINVSPQLFHLYHKEPKIDLCYSVDGENVGKCGDLPGDTSVYIAFHAVPGTTIGAAIEFRLHFRDSEVTGTATSISFDYGSGQQTVPVNGTLVDNTMTLLIHTDNGVVPDWVDCVPQPAPHCATCRYTGDHVVQDWEITGAVNNDHSTYSAEYTRKFIYTSVVVGSDCKSSTVSDEATETGALGY